MPNFAYSGRTRAGQTVSGERAADTMDAASAALRREQIKVTRITPAKAGRPRDGEEGEGVGKTRQEGRRQEPGGLHAAVLGDDRRRPAAGAVPRHSRHAGRRQELRRRHPGDAHRRRVGRLARRRDAEAPEDVRPAVHEHDCGGRGGRYSRHDSQAARDLHREGRQADRPGEVGDDLSGRRHRDRRRRRRRHSVEGHPDVRVAVLRPRRRPAAADARRHRAQQQPGAASSRSSSSAAAPRPTGSRRTTRPTTAAASIDAIDAQGCRSSATSCGRSRSRGSAGRCRR